MLTQALAHNGLIAILRGLRPEEAAGVGAAPDPRVHSRMPNRPEPSFPARLDSGPARVAPAGTSTLPLSR